ncbi:N-acetylmuramoyl-L-alanine amidase [Nisaea nitritireducens]|uniref:N-acetylmuramoyl-L-alanine amidase n=1 Tax=Nisaea nitritireducens TaxID=568392 RepID=UPI0018677883|nr:N-acetylmuramoyl-L-alanine amidase [Nisaea nitritireducens]
MGGIENIIERPSPNHDARPDGTGIDILLLHYTGMQSAEAALDRLTDPDAKVSAHYLIDEDGRCYRMVDEARRAWHAGVASWQGATDINARSIGIELVNPGHQYGYRHFPDRQMDCLTHLSKAILGRHPIPPTRVLAHSDVAPDRKEDPGELFNWESLARSGIGLWPAQASAAAEVIDFSEAMRLLSEIGYAAPEDTVMSRSARSVLLAFQRRWMPRDLTGALTPETAARIREVHSRIIHA